MTYGYPRQQDLDGRPRYRRRYRPAGMAAARRQSPLAANLTTLRDAAGLSQVALAEKSGLSVETIQVIESGDYPNPTISILAAIARALGTNTAALVGE